jgi:hypothetical protein
LFAKPYRAYADSAYQSQKHADWLSQKGIGNRLTKRAYRNRPLTAQARHYFGESLLWAIFIFLLML